VFLFTDTQIVHESFLEDVNNMLSSGEVPNLFAKDELSVIFDALRPLARVAGTPFSLSLLLFGSTLYLSNLRATDHMGGYQVSRRPHPPCTRGSSNARATTCTLFFA
jgi:hypothetical protein